MAEARASRPRSSGALVAVALASTVLAQEGADRAPRVASIPERQALFGDLHLHTAYSFDAIASGTQTTPEDAYRYAQGEAVSYLGRTVQRRQPLDFLAVTDHAEYLAVPYDLERRHDSFAETSWPDRIAAIAGETMRYLQLFAPSAFRGSAPPLEELRSPAIIESHWQREIAAAERFYRPGNFTTLVAFEWSPMPNGAHLHRNVIFRGPNYPARPFSALDSPRPEALWTYAENLRAQGIESVLIPHNSNLSQGLMFGLTDSEGDPITRAHAARRLANEPLVEITQNKGSSETRPEFGAPDEFADFELLNLPAEANADPAGGYLRPALARGLEIEADAGVNPYRFGFVGASDFHSGISASEEDNFAGALGRSDDMQHPGDVLTLLNPVSGTAATVFSASGLTGVWAERNTREAIFAALQRREVFATSGPRLRVRLFAGSAYRDDLLEQRDWVATAYANGVPMGADLPRAALRGGPLRLIVHATRDPEGANLDRLQIVKIWRANGAARERIHNVAWSDARTKDLQTGRLEPVGNSVDLATAGYTNTIGAAQLGAVWTDPDFDPAVPAIYYARVLQIPTPRWSTHLAIRNGLPLPDGVPATLQERAWTSPVFYQP